MNRYKLVNIVNLGLTIPTFTCKKKAYIALAEARDAYLIWRADLYPIFFVISIRFFKPHLEMDAYLGDNKHFNAFHADVGYAVSILAK